MLAVVLNPGAVLDVKHILVPSGEIDGWKTWAPLMWRTSVAVPLLSAGSL